MPSPSATSSSATSQTASSEVVTSQIIMSEIIHLRAQLNSMSRQQSELMQLILDLQPELNTGAEP